MFIKARVREGIREVMVQAFGFHAEKKGHVRRNWKRRYFHCRSGATGKLMITYWASQFAYDKADVGDMKGEIVARNVVAKSASSVQITDETGKVYLLRCLQVIISRIYQHGLYS